MEIKNILLGRISYKKIIIEFILVIIISFQVNAQCKCDLEFKGSKTKNLKFPLLSLGKCYLDDFNNKNECRKSDKEIFEIIYKSSLDENQPTAQYLLGIFFTTGFGTKSSPALAFLWMKKSADGGLPVALYLTGDSYEKGFGTEKNIEKAINYYEKAHEAGFPEAQDKLIKLKKLN